MESSLADLTISTHHNDDVKDTTTPDIPSSGKGANSTHPDSDAGESKVAGGERLAIRSRRPTTGDPSSPLENLPAELRSQVLESSPDLPTLRSLIHASPVVYAAYQHDRGRILRACFGRELDGLAVDACAALMSQVGELGSPRTDQMITDFLAGYRGWLSGTAPRPDVSSLDPDNAR